MKSNESIRAFGKSAGIFILLFCVLLLPMLHIHPADEHAHGATEQHRHQIVLHADFFPNATHGHEEHEQDDRQFDFSINLSQQTLSQIDLHTLHIAQSYPFSSIAKRSPLVFVQDTIDLSTLSSFQSGITKYQQKPPTQIPQFSSPSLRAPPHFA